MESRGGFYGSNLPVNNMRKNRANSRISAGYGPFDAGESRVSPSFNVSRRVSQGWFIGYGVWVLLIGRWLSFLGAPVLGLRLSVGWGL